MQDHSAKLFFITRRNTLRQFIAGRDTGIAGLAAIEFAILAPVLILMMICVVDLGMGIYRKMQVQNAAQAGAEYAMVHGYSASSVLSAVTNATSFSGIVASPLPNQFCGCPSNTGVTTISCGSTCTGGSTPGTYVTVSTQGTYNTLFDYPILPKSYNFTAQATVRIK